MGSTERVEVGGSGALASAHESVEAALREARESASGEPVEPPAPPAAPPAPEAPPTDGEAPPQQ